MDYKFTFKEVEDKGIWDSILSQIVDTSFMQSWEWGEFQNKGLGKKVYRYEVISDDISIGKVLLIEETTKFGKYLYAPRGPVFDASVEDNFWVVQALKDYLSAASYGHVFIQFEPNLLDTEDNRKHFKENGYIESDNPTQVHRSLVLDLNGVTNEEELYTRAKEFGMSSSNPRHIRKSGKSGVNVRFSSDLKDLEIVIDMLYGLADAKGLPRRSKDYYREQFKHLGPANLLKLAIAEKDGKPLSSLILATAGGEVTTVHGATVEDVPQSLYVVKKIYWESMKYALENGFKRFNYMGVISEEQMKDESHPWFGFSQFKRRMGGYEIVYLNPQDIVLKPLRYKAIQFYDKLRDIRYKQGQH